MNDVPEVQPLPYKHRNYFFRTLALIFLISLPFLFLYATGYRFQFGETTTLISTGGLYVAAERTGAEIYIDNELVRETRVFRQAFYAQSIEPGTHRVHVQKDGHHTWVKELPVYAHLVTEAQAFNLPVVPQVRIISPWRDVDNQTILFATSTLFASTTNDIVIATTTATTSLVLDTEFIELQNVFGVATTTVRPFIFSDTILSHTIATTTPEDSTATTTKELRGVRLYENNGNVYAEYVGEREEMPYYYCAETFPLLGTSTTPLLNAPMEAQVIDAAQILHPAQQVAEDAICDQVIHIDSREQKVTSFDFFPGGFDFVVVALEDGVYVVEVDARAWQNAQPILLGNELDVRVENGNIYVYDGAIMYHIQIET